MQTVIELPEFIRCTKKLNLSQEERERIVEFVSLNPDTGVEISGTGGMRKVRIAGKGKAKSGGYRVITFFSGSDIPVFLVSIYEKSQKENLTATEKNALRTFAGNVVTIYRGNIK